MAPTRTASAVAPITAAARAAARDKTTTELEVLWRRLEFSGAVPAGVDLRTALTGAAAKRVSSALERRGLPAAAGAPRWGDLAGLRDDPDAFAAAVRRLSDQIEMSPQPSAEWTPVIDVLGEPMTARLIGSSPSSVRRYAAGTRRTPQAIAERVHFLTLLLADLAGSYNAFGMRRWLTRPRTALGGQSPADRLGTFDPDGTAATEVADLAAALPAMGAT